MRREIGEIFKSSGKAIDSSQANLLNPDHLISAPTLINLVQSNVMPLTS